LSFRPPRAEPLSIAGPAGPIEALLEDPQAPANAGFAVVCHPHPLYGGTMTNKVVHTVARSLQEQGMPTVRFNFRGVGRSAGQFDEGRGETADALAVVAWGRERWPGVPTADEVVDCAQVEAFAARFAPPPALRLLPGVDHFFNGRLPELREVILQR